MATKKRAPEINPWARLMSCEKFGLFDAETFETFVELGNLTSTVNQVAALTGPGRVGFGINVQFQHVAFAAISRARFELRAIRHLDGNGVVFRVNFFFHLTAPNREAAYIDKARPNGKRRLRRIFHKVNLRG